MFDKINKHLNSYVPAKYAYVSITIAHLTTLAVQVQAQRLRNEVLAEKRANARWNEICSFLMERADDQTIQELDKRMDFWRVAAGTPAKYKEN